MDEAKPWYRSMTIVSSFLGIILMWGQTQGFLTPEQNEATVLVADRIVATVEAILAALTVWGFRRAVSPIAGPSGTAGAATVGALLVIGIAGCASYDASRVAALAATHAGGSTISTSECDAFLELAQALTQGPDVAIRFVGRANELERLAIAAQRHNAQCVELASRTGVNPAVLADVAASFDITWAAAEEATR